jgi:glycosyltransferase involved in cell wall biosynthesis
MPDQPKRMKVLMSAYVCQPNAGSEEGVGWNWAVQMARQGHQVHVVTQPRFQAPIEAELAVNPVDRLTFHYLEVPKRLTTLINHFGWAYYLWQIALIAKSKALHQHIGFDLAHHLTYAIDWMPSGLAWLNIPFVWGPIGGSTHQMPDGIDLQLSAADLRQERKRSTLQWIFQTFDPLLKLTLRRATRILPYTQEAALGIPDRYHPKVNPTVHVGVSPTDLPQGYQRSEPNQRGSHLRILTGGRLVHWKGFDLLLEGFKLHLQETGSDSKMVFTARWGGEAMIREMAAGLGIESHLVFLGDLPTRDAIFWEMQSSDLYALLTWRDGPPTAMLEAMLAGLPILCLDVGAVQELVPEGAGFKIALESRSQIIKDVAAAITWASQNRQGLEQMGAVGRQHVLERHNWDKIGDTVQQIYEMI